MADDPFDVWSNRTITVKFTWDSGNRHLRGPNARSDFTLVAQDGLGGDPGATRPFRLKVTSGHLPEFWDHVVLLPMGSDDPPAANKQLPPIGGFSNDDVLDCLRDIHTAADVGNTKMRRLEGYIPVATADPAVPKLDMVRMVYCSGVIENKVDPNKPGDFVVIIFRTVMGGGPQPNGGGSGPPD